MVLGKGSDENKQLSNASGTQELKMQVGESLELKPQEWITSLKASVQGKSTEQNSVVSI